MAKVVSAPEAEDHLLALFFQIVAASSADIAAKYTEAIVKQCEILRTFPEGGAQRGDIRPGLRVFGFRRRVSIAFEITGDVVTILGVFYGGRNIEAAFED